MNTIGRDRAATGHVRVSRAPRQCMLLVALCVACSRAETPPAPTAAGPAGTAVPDAADSGRPAGDARSLPPELSIDSPQDGAWQNSPRVRVAGRASGHPTLFFDNRRIAIGPDGKFDVEIDVPEGQGEIIVRDAEAPDAPVLARLGLTIDLQAPWIELTELPGTPLTTLYRRLCGARRVELAGVASDVPADGLATLSVGERPVDLGPDGSFRTSIELEREGENTIEVEAQDRAHNRAHVGLALVRDTTPPVVVIDQPTQAERGDLGARARIEGRVDDAHPERVTIDGTPVEIDGSGRFRLEIDLDVGTRELRIVAQDRAGLHSEEVRVALIRRPGQRNADHER